MATFGQGPNPYEEPTYNPPEKHEIAPQINNEEGVALTPTELLALLTERIMHLTTAVNKLAKVTMETRDIVNDGMLVAIDDTSISEEQVERVLNQLEKARKRRR